MIIDNGKQTEEINKERYREWIRDVEHLVKEQHSGGSTWNYGHGNTGIWTYPTFSHISDFDYKQKKVTIDFEDTYDCPISDGLTEKLPIEDCLKILHKLAEFAEKAFQKTGYTIIIRKHARIPFPY